MFLLGRDGGKLEHVKEFIQRRYKVRAECLCVDIRCADRLVESINELNTRKIKIHFLVNNAGVGLIGKFQHYSSTELLDLLNTNVLGFTLVFKSVLENMRLHGEPGIIVNVEITTDAIL